MKRNISQVSPRSTAGFSLVEMMIAMVAGLVVVGAVLSFTLASMQSNSENVRATRLSQELRTVMGLVTRELRRAGYNEDSIARVGRGTTLESPLDQVFISADRQCVIFAYDSVGGTAGQLDAGETKGLRRFVANGVGRVQYNPGADGNPTCASDRGWLDLSDPVVTDVTNLRFCWADNAVNHGCAAAAPGGTAVVRRILVDITGVPRVGPGAADFVRTAQASVRVRADCIRADSGECSAVPGT